MNVGDFEDAVWATDSIRVVIRAARNTKVRDFNWTNVAPETQSLTDYMRTRIQSRVGQLKFTVIDSHGSEPHGRMLLRNLRRSYH